MALLFIDSSQPDEAALWWMNQEGEEAWQAVGKARDLLTPIAARRAQIAEQAKGIAVVAGPGRFSSLRVGILYAHVVARWYKRPLYALTREDVASAESRAAAFHAIMRGERSGASYVAPVYDREPNITLPRV